MLRIVGNAHRFMYLIGVIEIVVGVVVAMKPRWAAYMVALWLLRIILNLITYLGFYDVALGDFGLLSTS
jgi:uncharacterized membrane protein HdeD (DUF308 family)